MLVVYKIVTGKRNGILQFIIRTVIEKYDAIYSFGIEILKRIFVDFLKIRDVP